MTSTFFFNIFNFRITDRANPFFVTSEEFLNIFLILEKGLSTKTIGQTIQTLIKLVIVGCLFLFSPYPLQFQKCTRLDLRITKLT